MRFFRFVGYFLIILLLLLVPLYGGVRIFLPEWVKGQLASMLPDDATLKIGEISSTARMGVLYKDLVFERTNTNTKVVQLVTITIQIITLILINNCKV